MFCANHPGEEEVGVGEIAVFPLAEYIQQCEQLLITVLFTLLIKRKNMKVMSFGS